MPEYLSPGVYMEEIPSGPVPIEGVSTSTAGFVGLTERGPIQPRLVTGWGDYVAWFGGFIDPTDSFLPWAVKGFFDNGGRRLFVARVVRNDADTAVLDHPTADPAQNLLVRAQAPGAWGDRIFIRIAAGTNFDPASPPPRPPITVTVLYYATMPPMPLVDPLDNANIADPNRREPTVVEAFENVGWHPDEPDFFIDYINARSKLVELAWSDPTVAPSRPNDTAFIQLSTTQGTDGAAALGAGDFTGNAAAPAGTRNGLAGLADIDEISILGAPDHVNTAALTNAADRDNLRNQVINQCEILKDRFAIVSVAAGQGNLAALRPPRDSSYAGFYAPWIRVFDPRTSGTHLVPPIGHVAGIYARVDIERGVHKAPANEVVRGMVTSNINATRYPLEFTFGKPEQDILNPRNVNVIRDFRADRRGIRVYGGRTMSSDPTWRYINVRRLLLYIEESIEEGTQWVVFEPNDEPLWARVRQSVRNFLLLTWRSGALQGQKEEEAFFVKCDRTTMTQADIDAGRLICHIGVAPVKPAEFVIFRIQLNTVTE
ncbi:MAG TPA: phage tail sheath family protein [Gammaproteobacteria bacterium]|nr:phage tail sheath family protein [Gammaproteobacteria bacterium]